MNATNLLQTMPNVPKAPNAQGLVVVNDATDSEKNACGVTVFWSLHGDVSVEALTAALARVESKALPPDAPSPEVALRRAVETAAKSLGHLDVHCVKRGEWAIVGTPVEHTQPDDALGETFKRQLVYPVDCTARLVRPEGGGEKYLEIKGRGEEQIRAAYAAAQGVLRPADIGNWLVEKVEKLGGIPLKDRGGVYFISQRQRGKWAGLVRALKICTKHTLCELPTMRSEAAVETILTALTADTRKACDKIAEDIGDGSLGDKALEARKNATAALLARVAQYEELLGSKLVALRETVAETEAAVAAATIAAMGAP